MNEILNVGVIGAGKMGLIRIKEIENNPNLHLMWIFDSKKPNIGKYNQYRWEDWGNPDELNRIPNGPDWHTDIVFVCTPHIFTTENVLLALNEGCHVFAEKPPGICVDDIRKMIDAEKKSGKILRFGFNHRYHKTIQDAYAKKLSGSYGKLLFMRGVYGRSGFFDWRINKDIAGHGQLLGQGIHMLDLFRWFAGEDFINFRSFVSNEFWKNEGIEDNVFAIMRTKSGIVAQLHSSATLWKHIFRLELGFEDGYIDINGLITPGGSFQGTETITNSFKHSGEKGRPSERITYYNTDPSWRAEIEDFIINIRENKKPLMGSSTDALRVMEMIEAIYEGDQIWNSYMKSL